MSNTTQDFWNQHAEWSEVTFGPSSERGPIGPTKHLLKEVKEVLEKLEQGIVDLEEYADCMFLLFDAVRRAGFNLDDLVNAAFTKLEKNKLRTWGKPIGDEPIEHVRGIHD